MLNGADGDGVQIGPVLSGTSSGGGCSVDGTGLVPGFRASSLSTVAPLVFVYSTGGAMSVAGRTMGSSTGAGATLGALSLAVESAAGAGSTSGDGGGAVSGRSAASLEPASTGVLGGGEAEGAGSRSGLHPNRGAGVSSAGRGRSASLSRPSAFPLRDCPKHE